MTLTEPLWARLLMWLGLPAVGAGAVYGLAKLADWVAGLSWAPFQGVFKLISEIPEPQRTWASLGIGALGGLILAVIGHAESLTLAVDHAGVSFRRDEKTTTVPKAEVTAAFLDGKNIVLLGRDGQELACEPSELDKTRIEQAFRSNGYAWLSDGDPHKANYRRWVESDPDLPPAADAFLRARARAIQKDEKSDAVELRQELARLGVVVRDEKKKQYWRHQ